MKNKIDLFNFDLIKITETIAEKYRCDEINDAIKTINNKKYNTEIYAWFQNTKLVATVGSFYEYGHRWIINLIVAPEYQGNGLSYQLIDFAVKNLNCDALFVTKEHDAAKHIYLKYGFKIFEEFEIGYDMRLN